MDERAYVPPRVFNLDSPKRSLSLVRRSGARIRGKLLQMVDPTEYSITLNQPRPLDVDKRATPDAHDWVRIQLLIRASHILSDELGPRRYSLYAGEAPELELVVKGPDAAESDRIVNRCRDAIEVAIKDLMAEFVGFRGALPNGESGYMMCAVTRLPGIANAATVVIGPATEKVQRELKDAGWQIEKSFAKRTINFALVGETMGWLKDNGYH